VISSIFESDTLWWIGPFWRLPLVGVLLVVAWVALWVDRIRQTWASLAKSYFCPVPFEGRLSRFRWVEIRYRSTLRRRLLWPADVGASNDGLFLRPWSLGRKPFRALCVPWGEIPKAEADWVVCSYVELQLRALPDVALRLGKKTAMLVAEEAGDAWPDGQFLLRGSQ
jgi:hypothetical protein